MYFIYLYIYYFSYYLIYCGVGEDSWGPLDCKEIKPVNPKGNQSRISIGRTDAKAEAPILWPPDSKSRLIRKDPDAGRDWRQEEKGTMRRGWDGWMASPTQWTWVWVNSRSRWWTGGLACCSPWGHKELDTTERLNWTETFQLGVKSLSWSRPPAFLLSIPEWSSGCWQSFEVCKVE